MSENAKVVALWLLLLVALGVVSNLGNQEALRSGQPLLPAGVRQHGDAAAHIPPTGEPLPAEDAVNTDCLNVVGLSPRSLCGIAAGSWIERRTSCME